MRLLISGSWVRAPRWAPSFSPPPLLSLHFLPSDWTHMLGQCCTCAQLAIVSLAPWLSWLKRLSSKQEIPSSNLGGALATQYFFLFSHSPLAGSSALMTNSAAVAKCRDPGSNRGPLDLQSNALPTELSRPLPPLCRALHCKWKTSPKADCSKECEVLPRFELGSLDSESRVLTITP